MCMGMGMEHVRVGMEHVCMGMGMEHVCVDMGTGMAV